MRTKTTTTKGNHFKAVSKRSRSATGGNKNTNARGRKKTAMSQMASSATRSLKGPDRGEG